ncbi:MAG: 7-cyano-7-deazaguanine synthase [Desulfovibrio sp.]|jgi:7-cyano-7-deazaguanine synthase|nr:7-cyano-7-deazaguanine synthase [Desulfovibrio sp.]
MEGMEGRRVFLSLSGGVDSTTLYAFLAAQKALVTPVFFRYPSKHNDMERAAAERVAARYCGNAGAGPRQSRPSLSRTAESRAESLLQVDLSDVFGGLHSSLLRGGPPLPEGEYSVENLGQTVVPGRNTVFLAVLAARAESAEGGKCYAALGVHGGDYAVYPDCRPEFIEAARRTISLSSQGKVELIAPFTGMNKAEVVRLGLELGVPYELTKSCYAGGNAPCRVCPTCRAREEAFAANGVVDPLLQR